VTVNDTWVLWSADVWAANHLGDRCLGDVSWTFGWHAIWTVGFSMHIEECSLSAHLPSLGHWAHIIWSVMHGQCDARLQLASLLQNTATALWPVLISHPLVLLRYPKPTPKPRFFAETVRRWYLGFFRHNWRFFGLICMLKSFRRIWWISPSKCFHQH